MSRPYDVGEYRTHDQIRDDLFPEFDDAGDPFDVVMWERAWDPEPATKHLSVVFGVTAVGTSASAVTRQPGGSPPSHPPEESPPAAQFLDVGAQVGSRDRRP